MDGVTASDLRRVVEVLGRLQDPCCASGGDLLPALAELIRCDGLAYSEVTGDPPRVVGGTTYPPGAYLDALPVFDAHQHEHPALPVLTARAEGRLCLAVSDLPDLDRFRRSALYTDFYRPLGVRDQLLAVVALGPGRRAVFVLNRSRVGFGRRDRALLDLLLPHLERACAHGLHVAQLQARLARPTDAPPGSTDRLDALTSREREVLERLAHGATDRQIARSLGVGVRTVHKHVERTYRKLEVGNRTSAVRVLHERALARS